jgi:hypothetical protein
MIKILIKKYWNKSKKHLKHFKGFNNYIDKRVVLINSKINSLDIHVRNRVYSSSKSSMIIWNWQVISHLSHDTYKNKMRLLYKL